MKESRQALTKLRAKRDDANDRILAVNLAIASGDWTSLNAFVEQEWEKKGERDAKDLLQAGQLAHQIGSARAKDLIIEAAAKAAGDPYILIGCYGIAVNAGWEDETTSKWLELAAALSGDPLSVLQIFRSVVDDPVPRCAHPPPASSSIARAPSSPRICEQQFR